MVFFCNARSMVIRFSRSFLAHISQDLWLGNLYRLDWHIFSMKALLASWNGFNGLLYHRFCHCFWRVCEETITLLPPSRVATNPWKAGGKVTTTAWLFVTKPGSCVGRSFLFCSLLAFHSLNTLKRRLASNFVIPISDTASLSVTSFKCDKLVKPQSVNFPKYVDKPLFWSQFSNDSWQHDELFASI